MITQQTEERVRILAFWEKHGLEATMEAFQVARRTLFHWQKTLKESGGQIESLTPKKTTPKNKRKRVLPKGLEERIITLRTDHPRLGKEKIFALVKNDYQTSVSSIGRILGDLKKQGRLPDYKPMRLNAKTGSTTLKTYRRKAKKLRRPQGYRVLELDTIVRFIDGVKRYTLTAIDTEARTSFAACYTSHGSFSARDFLRKTVSVLPDCPTHIQTDNGSEFAQYFTEEAKRLKLIHYHTYPRTPKMNAHVERFNRTLSEEFLRYHKPLMRDNVSLFNEKLIDWLLWYNGERPHSALGQKAPLQVLMERLNPRECQKWWTSTPY
jgi:transposase InsO family protein